MNRAPNSAPLFLMLQVTPEMCDYKTVQNLIKWLGDAHWSIAAFSCALDLSHSCARIKVLHFSLFTAA